MIFGCSSKKTDENKAEQSTERSGELVFSDASVKCEGKEGFLGGKHVNIVVSASVKNDTENPINADNLPKLVTNSGDEVAKPKPKESKLLSGETCSVEYKGELDLKDKTEASVSFDGKVAFSGLDDAQKKLNEDIANVQKEFADKDAAKEEKKAQDTSDKEAKKKAVEESTGKTADEALSAATAADYTPKFKDSAGVDVTKAVKDASNGSEAHGAKVAKVEAKEGLFFNSVMFTRDYTEPAAAQKREEDAAKLAEKEQEKNLAANETVSQKNARRTALSYLDFTAFSRDGLIKQLEYEKFSNEDATYAVDNCGADWNEQAAKMAASYLENMPFSHQSLVEQLVFEGFTEEEAEYGVSTTGL